MPSNINFFEEPVPPSSIATAPVGHIPAAVPAPPAPAAAPVGVNDYVFYASLPSPNGGCSI